MTGWDFFDYLLKEIQVVGIPGDGFGECGKGYFRFSTFGNPQETKEAANRLCNLLKKGYIRESLLPANEYEAGIAGRKHRPCPADD